MCRYCFDGVESGPLISPCSCIGGQKWVHMMCLRRWQRMVLVSQPTHPAFYTHDIRHTRCNVCTAEYTCEPPTRHELMESFTGSEIAALLKYGCIIGANRVFDQQLLQQMVGLPEIIRASSGYMHWIGGVYLITSVKKDSGSHPIELSTRQQVLRFINQLDGDPSPDDDDELFITVRGTRLAVTLAPPPGSHADVVSPPLTLQSLLSLPPPVQLLLKSTVPSSCGDDTIVAVNLSRPTPPASAPSSFAAAAAALMARARSVHGDIVSRLSITHFIGGPCESHDIHCCLLPGSEIAPSPPSLSSPAAAGGGGGGAAAVECSRGWSVIDDADTAISIACSRMLRASADGGSIVEGSSVVLTGLQQRAELNGEVGVALSFTGGRWNVRLRNGDGKRVRPDCLQLQGSSGGVLHVFWGYAGWSRVQLLGEVARGHWGLCTASVADITANPERRREGLDGRLVFAPVTEMTEEAIAAAAGDMDAMQESVRTATEAADTRPMDQG